MKNILITGTSRGIGFEMAKQLADGGHKVVALSRNTKPIEALKNQNITSIEFDIAEKSDFNKLQKFLSQEFHQVDILINNAGYLVNKPFSELNPEDFRKSYDVNVLGPATLIKIVLPFMNAAGHVINISSMGGVNGTVKFPGLCAYSSSKGAILTLTELLAEEYKETGPAFNALALGSVQTEMLEQAFPGLQAAMTAKEMAAYIVDFALTGNKYYNGKILQVSNSTP